MLTQIYVNNFILMDEVALTFEDGMSCFTGETGAGKSLLIDAIGILKGDRVSSSFIKEGKEKAVIEGVFEVHKGHYARTLLEDAGYDLEDDLLIITREFNVDGKSTARINRRIATVSFIREIMASLVDIHSQHDSQYLLNPKYHLQLLDEYVHADELKNDVKALYNEYKHLKDELNAALNNDYNEDDLDFLTFQLNEIIDANIKENELEELENEQKQMQNFEKISVHSSNAFELLEGNHGSLSALYQSCKELQNVDDDVFKNISNQLLDFYYELEDRVNQLKEYTQSLEFDEARFNEISERIFLIHKIMRKYGPSFSVLEQKKDEIEHKIDLILHRQDYLTKQEVKVKQAYDAYLKKATQLHDLRVEKSIQLKEQIETQLHDLHLPYAVFQVHIDTFEGNASGIDKVEFYGSMNPSMTPRALANAASGGELSRLMLGLKTVFSSIHGIETIIFDEIDTGVSGSVALAIGRKMQTIARNSQVFCVTHLAQVAACGSHHYLVKKAVNEEAATSITKLNDEQRIYELAAIASDSTSQSALAAAQELFQKAQSSF